MEHKDSPRHFLIRVTLVHVVTYLVIGVLASIIFGYSLLFEQPVIRDYMREFGSVSVFIGPVVQVLRGAIIAAVLLPFRGVIAGRLGWLWLWLLLVGIGILSTSAAAPSSIEGVVYTKIPLWYHAIGLPEMLVQTFVFSVLVGLYARYPQGLLAVMPPVFERIVRALVTACIAFAGYAVVSVVFALTSGAGVDAEQSLSLRVQGLFIAPFIANGAIAFLAAGKVPSRAWRFAAGLGSYLFGAAAIFVYQALISGGVNPLYALLAPILPAVIVWLLVPHKPVTAPSDPDLGELNGRSTPAVSEAPKS